MMKIVKSFREPFLLLAVLWPTVLLVPHLPGIPRPSVAGLPWRQEIGLTFFLTLTLLLIKIKKYSFDLPKNGRAPLFFAILFVCWIWLSAFWATDSFQAVHMAIQWTSYAVFFFLITSAPARAIKYSIVVLGTVVAVLAIASVIESWFGAPLTDGNLRVAVKPILRGSGTFGEIMGAASVLFVGFALYINRRRVALLWGAAALLSWLATLQSLERAPFLGTSIGLVVLGTTALLSAPRQNFVRVGLLTVAFAIVLGSQMLPEKVTNNRPAAVARFQQNLAKASNTQARLFLWGIGLEMLRAHPLIGVGGNNYQANYAEGRAQFSSKHPDSPLLGINEHLLPIYAHNEYVQMLAELGVVGFTLFTLLICSLIVAFRRALKTGRSKLPIVGAMCAMLAFAMSSGASASSFRYLSGGLIFFFAAALIVRQANRLKAVEEAVVSRNRRLRLSTVPVSIFCAIVPLSLLTLSTQAAGLTLQAVAENSTDTSRVEHYYHAALWIYPSNTSGNFSYGMWLYHHQRPAESLPYLRRAVANGLNSSICYEYLAAAEDFAGDHLAAERTLSRAVDVYPQSVFLLTRHAVALQRLSKNVEAEGALAKALAIDPRTSRGWHHLILEDVDKAYAAAMNEPDTALPGELMPEAAVFAVLQENEMRDPQLANGGWRQRMRSAENRLNR
jgi:O-antigen ligase/Tfp pilus assembly protein PilF